MNLPEIKTIVADAYGITVDDIDGRDRKHKVATARAVVYYYARKFLGLKYVETGKAFGRDHTSIHNGVKKIEGYREYDFETQAMLEGIEAAYPCLTGRKTA